MERSSYNIDLKLLSALVGIIAITFFLSLLIENTSVTLTLAVFAGLTICIATFLDPQIGLYILVFSMLLFPEFGQRTTSGKGMTLRVDDFLLVLIGLVWLARTALYKDLNLFQKTPLNKPIFLYIVACILSTALGMMTGNVEIRRGFFFVLKYVEYYVVYFMVVNHIQSKKQVKYLVICLLVTCAIVDIVGLAQIPSGKRLSAPFEGDEGEPNTLGGYLILMLSLSLALLANLSHKKLRVLLLVFIGLTVFTFMLTLSRGSYAAFFPMYLTLIALSHRKKLLISFAVIACLAAPILVPVKVIKRVTYTYMQKAQLGQEKIGGIRLDTSTSIRLRSWSSGLEAVMDRPIFGYGVTGWYFIDNQFTKVLVETGIVGLAAFIFLLASIFKHALKVFKKAHDALHKAISIGFIGGVVGMTIHALAANTFIIVRIMEPFWLLAGVVMVIPTIEIREKVDASRLIPNTGM